MSFARSQWCASRFLVETIQKLSACLLTVRHVLSKKGQSFLCISLPIFTFSIQFEELGRRFKSLDPHFVLSFITENFLSASVLYSFLCTSLACREHKADNLETDPNCALQTKGSLCVTLASCHLCPSAQLQILQKLKILLLSQRAGKQSCCWWETIPSFSQPARGLQAANMRNWSGCYGCWGNFKVFPQFFQTVLSAAVGAHYWQ